jgi:1,4-dihydroxy-2-naphthoate octaprenyltransferase
MMINLRDRETDVRAGKHTLAVRLGAGAAVAEYAGLIGMAYAVRHTSDRRRLIAFHVDYR